MKALHEIQKDFRLLNNEFIEEYEHAVKLSKEEEKQKNKVQIEKENQKRKILENAGIDLKMIDKIEKEDAATFQKTLPQRRQELINRKSQLSSELQSRQFYSELLSESNSKTLFPFGACIMASDQKLVENIDGERGNPWVLPDNPSQIKIKDSGDVDVWCWQAYARTPSPVVNIWFHFVPNVTGKWNLTAILAFHGFYILRSDDSWYNCRRAWAKLTASVQAYQYAWQGKKNFTLLDKSETNADYFQLFDSTEFLDGSAFLRAGDRAWVLVTIRVEAFSVGGDNTYAELNFKDGSGNYILPLFVSCSPA